VRDSGLAGRDQSQTFPKWNCGEANKRAEGNPAGGVTSHSSLATSHCISNRYTPRLEPSLTHLKQTTVVLSNRYKIPPSGEGTNLQPSPTRRAQRPLAIFVGRGFNPDDWSRTTEIPLRWVARSKSCVQAVPRRFAQPSSAGVENEALAALCSRYALCADVLLSRLKPRPTKRLADLQGCASSSGVPQRTGGISLRLRASRHVCRSAPHRGTTRPPAHWKTLVLGVLGWSLTGTARPLTGPQVVGKIFVTAKHRPEQLAGSRKPGSGTRRALQFHRESTGPELER